MQRYFAKEKIDDKLVLSDSDYHHIKSVMRNKPGDIIEVIYQNIVNICSIITITPLELKVISKNNENNELPINLTVAVSLVNEQKFDLILQKLTELGVSTIIPIKTTRSIVKIDDNKIIKKISRWQTICKEASEQSKRTVIPKVKNIITLKELLNENIDLKLICSLNETAKPINEYLDKKCRKILFAIGPEGGFTKEEEKQLLENGFYAASLGKRVMRVETAAIYVASIINYIYEG